MLNWLKHKIGIPTLEEKLAALQARVKPMEDQLFSNQLQLTALQTNAEQMEAQLASDPLPEKLDILRERIELLESKIAQLTNGNGSHADKLDILRSRLDQLEQRVTSDSQELSTRITDSNGSQVEKLGILRERLGSLESRITTDAQSLSTKINTIVTNQLKTQLQVQLGRSLTLTSPNGKQSISLLAGDHCSGIWIAGEKGEPMVAIYKMVDRQGAVIGIYGPADKDGNRRSGLDACFYYDTSGEDPAGAIQLLTADNCPLLLELAAGEPLENFTKFGEEGKFVGYIPLGIDEG